MQSRRALVEQTSMMLAQSERLRQEAQELRQLQAQADQLQQWQAELSGVNLGEFRQQIASQAQFLQPQHQILSQLHQEKKQLDEQVKDLQHQQNRLQTEIEQLRSQRFLLSSQIARSAAQLVTLKKIQRARLGGAITTVLSDLEQQQQEYESLQERLQQAIQEFNHYQTATEELRLHLQTHYRESQALAKLLPVNHEQIAFLVETVGNYLGELDRELAIAQQHHQQSQAKTIYNF
ncbi:MAG: hypothetical protein HC890_07220 [Chloroflexaceae bacterium]|nr:hypothetical protein [Chloroflexaceae bacterium]